MRSRPFLLILGFVTLSAGSCVDHPRPPERCCSDPEKTTTVFEKCMGQFKEGNGYVGASQEESQRCRQWAVSVTCGLCSAVPDAGSP